MISNYEQIRLENIKRNEIYLTETLGIDITIKETKFDIKSSRKRRINNNSNNNDHNTLKDNYNIPLRRSNRVASLPTVNYIEFPTIPASTSTNKSSNYKDSISQGTTIQDTYDISIGHIVGYQASDMKTSKSYTEASSELLNVSHISHHNNSNITISCSCLNANYNYFMTDENICKFVNEYGKASIMQLSNNNIMPKFNKYPGVIEWLNCIYLWVNIDGISSSDCYPNVFSEEGRYMMWFGGSKMHKDSKLTQRLISISNPRGTNYYTTTTTTTTTTTSSKKHNPHPQSIKKEDTDIDNDIIVKKDTNNSKIVVKEEEVVLLFVRFPKEPYACLGRLHWVSMDLTASPIKIKWELIDHKRYFQCEYFQHILKYNANK